MFARQSSLVLFYEYLKGFFHVKLKSFRGPNVLVVLFLGIWSYLPKKSLMKNFIFCVWKAGQVIRHLNFETSTIRKVIFFWFFYYLMLTIIYLCLQFCFLVFFSWKSRKFIRWCKLNASLNYNVMYWYSPQVLYIFLVCLHKKSPPQKYFCWMQIQETS